MRRVALCAVTALFIGTAATAQEPAMTFFITSVGSGDGANLGGVAGADRHCQALAEAAGSEGVTWRAYLSTLGPPVEHARDRIGSGPWYNVNGVMVAESVEHLHGENNNLTKETVLTENGDMVKGRGDQLNMHDIITGSNLDGSAFMGDGYDNCDDWTSSGDGSVRVGHHDRVGGGQNPTSWNSAHGSRGCSQEALQGTGGNGLFYCFGII